MGPLVNGNGVCICGKEPFANLHQTLATLVEDRNDAAFGRNMETTECLIKGKHVRVCADRLYGGHFLSVQIKYCKLCIFFAGHECQTMLAVDVESVASAATGQGI